MKFHHAIGIIGGAGPQASAFLYSSILEVCQKDYGSNDFNAFPEILIVSYPFTRGNPERITTEIALCLQKLESAGAHFYAMACNTFHAFLPDVSKYRFVHLIQEALQEAARLKLSKSLILAAPKTVELKLYEESLMLCVYPSPEDQLLVNGIIREVASGEIGERQSRALSEIISRTRKNHPIDGVVLGCTELPLVHAKRPVCDLPIVDSVKVLAKRLVALAAGVA